MQRKWLLDKIESYRQSYPEEHAEINRLVNFIESTEDCFKRTMLEGHITGSCLLLSPDKEEVLITHHKKLGKWIQLGGHSDGDPNTLNVALREAQEESGIMDVKALSDEIFSIDIHKIPARKDEPEHYHYDISFLLIAGTKDYEVSEESEDLRWVPIFDPKNVVYERTLQNMMTRLRTEAKWLRK